MLLEISSNMHIRTNPEIAPILALQSPHMLVVTSIAQQTIMIAGTLTAHPRCIFSHLYISFPY